MAEVHHALQDVEDRTDDCHHSVEQAVCDIEAIWSLIDKTTHENDQNHADTAPEVRDDKLANRKYTTDDQERSEPRQASAGIRRGWNLERKHWKQHYAE